MCQLVGTLTGNGGELAGKRRGDFCRCGTMGPLLPRRKYPESLQTDLSFSLSSLVSIGLSSSLVRCLHPVHFRSYDVQSVGLLRPALATAWLHIGRVRSWIKIPSVTGLVDQLGSC